MTRNRWLLGVLFVVAVTLAGCTSLIKIDLSGVWQGELTWTDGPARGFVSPIALHLIQDDRQVDGTITLVGPGSQSFSIDVTHGRTTGKTFVLEASGLNEIVNPPTPVSLSLDGTAENGSVFGTGAQTIGPNTYRFTWTADLVSSPGEPAP